MTQGLDLNADSFINGEVGSDNYKALQFGDIIIDSGMLDSAYIACNNELTTDIDGSSQRGTLEVPIWNPDGSLNEKFAELEFSNATYINGAIVMTVKNGCEGNLVIIPVQRDKYVPPVVPPQAPRSPGQPITPGVPTVVDLPPYSGITVNCDGVEVSGTRVMQYDGYEIYLAAGRIFRVKNNVVESRSFGLDE